MATSPARVPAMSEHHASRRQTLEEERINLLHQIDELTVGGEIDLEFDDDFSDRSLVASEQGENFTLANTLQVQLTLVEHALARFEAGTYGACETCGRSISADRLDALPATNQCIEHAGEPPPGPSVG